MPFLGPRADESTISEFRTQKLDLLDNEFPHARTQQVVAQFFDSVRDTIVKEVGKDTLLITVPSGSGENTIPLLFAKHLAKETGAEVLPQGMIAKLHKGQAKLNLSLDDRVHDPIRYEIFNSSRLKQLASTYERVVIVDDLVNSGESCVRLRKTLENSGIKVHAFANLVNVENRSPSPADLNRVYNRISELANLTLSDKLKLKNELPVVFEAYTKQKLNYVERSLGDQKSAILAFKTISKASAQENKLNVSQEQGVSL
jgi:hypothetical protein